MKIKDKKIHIGLIPDGCRRWANVNHKDYVFAYRQMVEKVFSITCFLFEQNCNEISVYFSSKENLERNENEVLEFNKAEEEFLTLFFPILSEKLNVNLNIAGNLNLIPISFKDKIEETLKANKLTNENQLNLCIGYSPEFELSYALSKDSNIANIKTNLQIVTPIDIIIRTGKENCLSNFLPLQSVYSRIFFLDKYINDVNIEDVNEILDLFNKTNRRYGK